jgi:hypothetical protein
MAELTAVRAGRHPTFDRIVFQFSGPAPGYRVEYVGRPVREQGSGKPVPVDGNAFVKITLSRARAASIDASGVHHTYGGPDRIHPDLAVVREVVETADYEGNLGWAIGLDAKVPVRVFRLDDPSRVVIDFASR